MTNKFLYKENVNNEIVKKYILSSLLYIKKNLITHECKKI